MKKVTTLDQQFPSPFSYCAANENGNFHCRRVRQQTSITPRDYTAISKTAQRDRIYIFAAKSHFSPPRSGPWYAPLGSLSAVFLRRDHNDYYLTVEFLPIPDRSQQNNQNPMPNNLLPTPYLSSSYRYFSISRQRDKDGKISLGKIATSNVR